MRMRLALFLLAGVVIGGVGYWRSREHAAPTAAAPKVATPVTLPEFHDVRTSGAVTVQQEAAERSQIEHSARELKITDGELEQVLAAVATMQAGRRELFADLAARKRPIEDVSAKLRELRDQMNASFETSLGKERAAQLQQQIRLAHGGEAASPSQ